MVLVIRIVLDKLNMMFVETVFCIKVGGNVFLVCQMFINGACEQDNRLAMSTC